MPYAFVIPATGSPDVLDQRLFTLRQPAEGEVLIRNYATAVNAIDTIIRRGAMPSGTMPALPYIPGVEGAGIIEALGAGVEGFATGDRVAWMVPVGTGGGYASHTVVATQYVTGLPDQVDFNSAAALPVNALTAWHMLVNLGRVQAGDSVLVHAASTAMGTMILKIANHLKLNIMATVRSGQQDYVLAQGAHYAIDYQTENVIHRVRTITQGRGVDLTLNPLGGEVLTADMEVLAPLGTAILFDCQAGAPTGNFATDMIKHFRKSIGVRTSDIYTYLHTQPEAFSADMAAVFQLPAQNVLCPQITTLPLEQAATAQRRLESGKTSGKLILTIA